MRRVYVYAFNQVFEVVACQYLEGDEISIKSMLRLVAWMQGMIPDAVTVCAMDNRPGLARLYHNLAKSTDFTKRIEFADMVATEGLIFS